MIDHYKPESDRALAMLMRAFLSRPERWSVEEYRWDVGGGKYRVGKRFTINGTIETDESFMQYVLREFDHEKAEGGEQV